MVFPIWYFLSFAKSKLFSVGGLNAPGTTYLDGTWIYEIERERVTKTENIKTDLTKILRPTHSFGLERY